MRIDRRSARIPQLVAALPGTSFYVHCYSPIVRIKVPFRNKDGACKGKGARGKEGTCTQRNNEKSAPMVH